MKIRPGQTDEQTDLTKLIAAFRNLGNAFKMQIRNACEMQVRKLFENIYKTGKEETGRRI